MHGPGYSKVVIGPDVADDWQKHLDVIAESIADNGGRSCVNASGVWTATRGREIAEALAARLADAWSRARRTTPRRCSRRSPTRTSRGASPR